MAQREADVTRQTLANQDTLRQVAVAAGVLLVLCLGLGGMFWVRARAAFRKLRRNQRLTSFVVQNLNTNPLLPFGDGEFDGAGITVSVDYLTQPVAVLRDLGRVLKHGSPVVITFSNRCFPTKAVAIWHHLDDRGRLELVARYLEEAGNWAGVAQLDRSPKAARLGWGDPLYAVVARARPAA